MQTLCSVKYRYLKTECSVKYLGIRTTKTVEWFGIRFLCRSPGIVRVLELRFSGNVARMGEVKEWVQKFGVECYTPTSVSFLMNVWQKFHSNILYAFVDHPTLAIHANAGHPQLNCFPRSLWPSVFDCHNKDTLYPWLFTVYRLTFLGAVVCRIFQQVYLLHRYASMHCMYVCISVS